VTPNVAVPICRPFVAVIVTVPGDEGATYVALFVPAVGVIVPLDAVHVTVPPAGTVVAVKLTVCPSVRPPRFGVTVTPEATAATVIAAVAVFVVSVTDVAVSVTNGGVGIAAGAVYVTATPEALVAGATVPQVAPVHPVPDNAQLTPAFAVSFVTVALNACASPTVTLAVVSESVTPTPVEAAVTVIVAAPAFVPSATDVAVAVTAAGLGALAGAVYVTAVPDTLLVAESTPHAAALQPAPVSAQVTPLLVLSLATVAVNGCVCPATTEAVPGATVTAITGSGAGLELEPPHPLAIAPPTNANANNDRAARTKGTRVKAVSVFFVLVFLESTSFRGAGSYPYESMLLSPNPGSRAWNAGGPRFPQLYQNTA
jgi:hypothetical protein